MKEETKYPSFICFNEKARSEDGGSVCVIVNIEDMNLTNEEIIRVREILTSAADQMRALFKL